MMNSKSWLMQGWDVFCVFMLWLTVSSFNVARPLPAAALQSKRTSDGQEAATTTVPRRKAAGAVSTAAASVAVVTIAAAPSIAPAAAAAPSTAPAATGAPAAAAGAPAAGPAVSSGDQLHFDALERQINEALVRLSMSEEVVAASLKQAAGSAGADMAAPGIQGKQLGLLLLVLLGWLCSLSKVAIQMQPSQCSCTMC